MPLKDDLDRLLRYRSDRPALPRWDATIVSYPLAAKEIIRIWLEHWQEEGVPQPDEIGIRTDGGSEWIFWARRNGAHVEVTIPFFGRQINDFRSALDGLRDGLASRAGAPVIR